VADALRSEMSERPFFALRVDGLDVIMSRLGSSEPESLVFEMVPRPRRGSGRSVADDDAVAAGVAGDVLVVLGGAGASVILVAAAGAAAVEADAVALAGNAVALAGAGAAVRGRGAVTREVGVGRRAVGAVGQVGAGGRHGAVRGAEVGDDVLVVVEAGRGKARAQLLDGGVVKAGIDDLAGGIGRHGLGGLDLGDGQGAALGDIDGEAGRPVLGRGLVLGAGVAGRALVGGRRLGRLGRLVGGDIQDVQLAASGGLDGGLLAGVVRDVVAVDDVVVPVALAGLERGALEAEGTLPRAGLGGRLVLGKRELTDIVVPGAEKVDGLDAGREAKRELKSRHVCLLLKKGAEQT